MAVGTLAIGLTFIGGTFLTGLVFSTVATERTIAAVAAEEAFAKMRIYGLDPNDPDLTATGFVDYNDLVTVPTGESLYLSGESLYPSIRKEGARQYSWSAICRRESDSSESVQCAVFVSRETGGNSSYWRRKKSGAGWPQLVDDSVLPCPVRINVGQSAAWAGTPEIEVRDVYPADPNDERTFVSEGSILMDDATGDVYRVLERSPVQLDRVILDRKWQGGDLTSAAGGWVWVIPPAVSGGRNPGIAVYQKIIRFPRR